MNQDFPTPDDQQLYQLLRQLDEALDSGETAMSLDDSVSALERGKAKEFAELRECISLLEEARRSRDGHGEPVGSLKKGFAATGTTIPLQTIGRFELRGELGRGGCGVVFRAYDPKLAREVAVKVPRPEALISDELRDRFLREARAAGNLDHPNVVPVFEVGEDGPICYIAAAYVEGPSLMAWLRMSHDAVSEKQAAAFVATLAEAVDVAHGRGVIHRDIKPGNVLLQPKVPGTQPSNLSSYIPKLTDFGLAKLRESGEVATRTGMVVGTPAYMAPEQARGQLSQIGPATDVYALGAILYELVAGRPPVRGETEVDTLRRIVADDPPLVRISRPGVSRDIEAICIKCLEKRPTARYESASALAVDLQRFLDGRATQARPIGPARRLARWSRRRPAIAALLFVSLISLAVLSIGSLVYSARLADALHVAEAERTRAEHESLASRQLLYSADVRLAYDAWSTLNRARTLQLLSRHIPGEGQTDLREFAWHWLWGQCHAEVRSFAGHTDEVFGVAFSPDGKSLATCGKDRTARIWDFETGKAHHVLRGHTDEVIGLAFSPDGKQLATAGEDNRIILWDTQTGQTQVTLDGHQDDVLAVAYSPDGRQLASGGRDNLIRVWNLETRKTSHILDEPSEPVRCIRFSPDGLQLAACDESGAILLWSTSDWRPEPPLLAADGQLFAIDFRSDAKHLIAAGRDTWLYDWDLNQRTFERFIALENHGNWIRDARLASDDTTVATCNHNGFVRLWNLSKPAVPDDAALLGAIAGHTGRIWGLSWSPTGNLLATAGADRMVKVWDVTDYLLPTPFNELDGWIWDVEFTNDSQTLVCLSRTGAITSWDLAHQSVDRSCKPAASGWARSKLAITGNGKTAVISSADDEMVRCFVLDSGNTLFEFGNFVGGVHSVDISPNDKLLAIGTEDGSVSILNLLTGKPHRDLPHDSDVGTVTFSPDGERLITSSRELRLWDVETGSLLWSRRHSEANPRGPVFSPDGEWIATSVGDDHIGLINTASGELVESLLSVDGRGDRLAFSPDGNTLASGVERTGVVTLWDVRTYQELCVLETELMGLFTLTFSPDGKRLVAAGQAPSTGNAREGTGRIIEWVVR